MSAKLSILTFPQKQTLTGIEINVLIIPRNFSPFADDSLNALSPAWVQANLRLQAMVINGLERYPELGIADFPVDLPGVQMPPSAASVFNFLNHPGRLEVNSGKKADPMPNPADGVRKYLPESYRKAFSFTGPRNPALTELGDGYRCAINDKADPDPLFVTKNEVSWGKLFAYCLRQPALARACGFIHQQLQVPLPENTFTMGGWLYVDLHPECSYFEQAQADPAFVKRYAARMPKLVPGGNRPLFAAVQFPVLLGRPPLPDDPILPSMLDEVQVEAATYDDGFCKIVHCNQPVSGHLLNEVEDEETPVTQDLGIRLGWDDEQLLAWMHRQLSPDPAQGGTRRADVPLGVFQYRLDVQDLDGADPGTWLPLCKVRYRQDTHADDIVLGNAGAEEELGVEVYPARMDARKNLPFWLPAYFTTWMGKSLVLQDEDAIAVFRKEEIVRNHHVPSAEPKVQAMEQTPRKAVRNAVYDPVGLEENILLYGHRYRFRVRMADTTGGGPGLDTPRVHDAEAPEATCAFKRYVIPQTLQFETPVPEADDAFFEGNVLSLKRPLLGYPSVVFTSGYDNAVDLLVADAAALVAQNELLDDAHKINRDIGLPDPDVNRVEILVEVRGLEMDATLPKKNPKDPFAPWYIVQRNFPDDRTEGLSISLQYIDVPVVQFTGSSSLSVLGAVIDGPDDLDKRKDLVLPTARDIRITIRPLCAERENYYGGTEKVNGIPQARKDLRGMATSFMLRKESTNEKALIKATAAVQMIRGLYLQPDEPIVVKPQQDKYFVTKPALSGMVAEGIQRLAQAIDADSKGLSLMGPKGERWQFGGSRFIRHTLAPDAASLTLGSRDDLVNHWLVPITLHLNRDWSWDGLQPTGFRIFRQKIFLHEAMAIAGVTNRAAFLEQFSAQTFFENEAFRAAIDEEEVGDLELKAVINITALQQADRSQTHLCFLDAVEPKRKKETEFPDEIFLAYRIMTQFRDGSAADQDADLRLYLHLPITTPPAQLPKIVSAGIAASRYVRDEAYANTEVRERHLWVEFDQALQNREDGYFVRMLGYGPDPLLAEWRSELFETRQDPPLPLDPEPVRLISPGHTDDRSGINAMQRLVPADKSNRHFLVPLPPGLHMEAPELFGFFKLEFRVGHVQGWSTAQGRFGRPLHNTGVQFPPPQLLCAPYRHEKWLQVTAPFARAVYDGRNFTASPPRTQLWALLYARVRMADDSDNRNILLHDRKMRLEKRAEQSGAEADAIALGVAIWNNEEIDILLQRYGLPEDCGLSIVCVELLPAYDRFIANEEDMKRRMSEWNRSRSDSHFNRRISGPSGITETLAFLELMKDAVDATHERMEENEAQGPRPLTRDLGFYRILRTSTLAAVPEVCCTE